MVEYIINIRKQKQNTIFILKMLSFNKEKENKKKLI